jgi:excisionase family DNA binding protein
MENYWKVREVAAALQISVQSVYRYVANGEIPYHKLNRSVRFKPSEIERWIESKVAGISAAESESLDESVIENARTEGGGA